MRMCAPRGSLNFDFATGKSYDLLIGSSRGTFVPLSESISAEMSADFHAVVRGPSLTGAGALPSRTHCHQVDRPMGMSGGVGGLAFGFPIICAMRINAEAG